MKDGSNVSVEAREFSHHIGNIKHWFACHESVDHYGLAVTHLESGIAVGVVDTMTRASSHGDNKLAAKMFLAKLIVTHGAEKIRSVIDYRKVK